MSDPVEKYQEAVRAAEERGRLEARSAFWRAVTADGTAIAQVVDLAMAGGIWAEVGAMTVSELSSIQPQMALDLTPRAQRAPRAPKRSVGLDESAVMQVLERAAADEMMSTQMVASAISISRTRAYTVLRGLLAQGRVDCVRRGHVMHWHACASRPG